MTVRYVWRPPAAPTMPESIVAATAQRWEFIRDYVRSASERPHAEHVLTND